MTPEHDSVYLAWQDPSSREWHVVGLLSESSEGYVFNYTNGAKNSVRFIPFSGMSELDKTYISKELFPFFKNRLLSPKRPEYPRFIQWLKLDSGQATPINVLGRSGAMRTTDQLQMFKKIYVQDNGEFEHIFFAHGLGHLSSSAQKRVSSLLEGERLFLTLDCQNSYDKCAVLIRAENPAEIVGYCPRYIARDIGGLIKFDSGSVKITVESLSDDAPVNYKLMCKIKGVIAPECLGEFMVREEFGLVNENSALQGA